MEIHQLKYVVAVARIGNFSKAAESCFVAQPSLSQQIQKLEAELGERLFERMKRSVKLTSHGERFLVRALRILEEIEMTKQEASDAKKMLSGKITVGVLPTIAPYMIPEPLARFGKKFPLVEVVIQEDTTTQLVKQLLACELDFLIASHPIRDDRLTVETLFHEELLLAVQKRHALAKKSHIAPKDLDGERLIVMHDGHCLGEQVLGFCDRREVRAQVSFRSAQLETILELVRSGVGLSLIPAMAAQRNRGAGLVYRSFASPKPERRVVIAWIQKRPPNRAAREFIDEVTRQSK